jgi:phosphoglycerate dehydrogenase-like enzyme
MPSTNKTRLLINLPPTFFTTPELRKVFARFAAKASIRQTSWNTPEEIEKDLAWAQAIVMWSWPMLKQDLLEKAKDLKFAGHINISLTGAKAEVARGLAVSEARHGWSPAVAEMALTLVMAGLRKTSVYHAAMRVNKEKWVGDFPGDIDPLERQLTGRTVGIVGLGRIGQRLAELLGPFHVKLSAFDPYLPESVAKQYNAQLVPLIDLIRNSEVVVLCAASVEGARNLLGPKEINALQKNAVLVNVGRSMLVDMKALAERLKKNDMVAMLDVFDKEPLEADSVFRTLPNAFLTPHRAGGVMESVERILNMIADDFDAFLDGRPLKYPVTEKTFPALSDNG